MLSLSLIVLLTLLLFINTTTAVISMTIENNFRPVVGTTRIYRCAKTEPLASVTQPKTDAERIILQETGLVLDLRSDKIRYGTRRCQV